MLDITLLCYYASKVVLSTTKFKLVFIKHFSKFHHLEVSINHKNPLSLFF